MQPTLGEMPQQDESRGGVEALEPAAVQDEGRPVVQPQFAEPACDRGDVGEPPDTRQVKDIAVVLHPALDPRGRREVFIHRDDSLPRSPGLQSTQVRLRRNVRSGTGTARYWQASHSGLSIEQNLPAASAAPSPRPSPMPPCVGTEFSSPPLPVDFSAEVAASVRR